MIESLMLSIFVPQLHHVDGLTQSSVRQCLEARENCDKDLIPLIGKSGNIWGVVRASKICHCSMCKYNLDLQVLFPSISVIQLLYVMYSSWFWVSIETNHFSWNLLMSVKTESKLTPGFGLMSALAQFRWFLLVSAKSDWKWS